MPLSCRSKLNCFQKNLGWVSNNRSIAILHSLCQALQSRDCHFEWIG